MPLYECVDQHWLLLVADVTGQNFLVFDSLLRKRATARITLIESAVSTLRWLSPLTASTHVPLRIMPHMNVEECPLVCVESAGKVW